MYVLNCALNNLNELKLFYTFMFCINFICTD